MAKEEIKWYFGWEDWLWNRGYKGFRLFNIGYSRSDTDIHNVYSFDLELCNFTFTLRLIFGKK